MSILIAQPLSLGLYGSLLFDVVRGEVLTPSRLGLYISRSDICLVTYLFPSQLHDHDPQEPVPCM